MPFASSHRPMAESGCIHARSCESEGACQGESPSSCVAFEIGTIRNQTLAGFGWIRICIAEPRPIRTNKTPLYSDTSSVTSRASILLQVPLSTPSNRHELNRRFCSTIDTEKSAANG